ncbi:hypothetical protein BGV57_25995 [Burkholderia ubonensis]|nr:hypothetical protein WM15_07350 [Burkholderia ubonensis]OJB36512.1 hypothetical protein BGV57_25995 [Burkholderia ubonensis]
MIGLAIGAAVGAGVTRYFDASAETEHSYRIAASCHELAANQFGATAARYVAVVEDCKRRFQ